jgi:competence protein ComEA
MQLHGWYKLLKIIILDKIKYGIASTQLPDITVIYTITRPSIPTPSPWFLRRADQSVAAVLLLSALAAMGGWWIAEGGPRSRLVEADRTQQHVARFQVDINTAGQPELVQLPGIGETLAQRIIETRQAHGPFTEPDDLRRVRGIGPKIMERLRPYLLPLPKYGLEAKN